MKFTSTVISLLAVALPVLAQTESLSYDNTYDNADQSLTTVACSDGPNGLMSLGYTTLGQLPTFPNVGGVAARQLQSLLLMLRLKGLTLRRLQ